MNFFIYIFFPIYVSSIINIINCTFIIRKNDIIFSAGSSTFSYNFYDGKMNWEQELSSIGTPIIDGKNIFFVTENGYFVIMNKDTGRIIASNNI